MRDVRRQTTRQEYLRFASPRIAISPCVILIYFASSRAEKSRKSRTVESNGNTDGNARRFARRRPPRAEGGKTVFRAESKCANYWKSVGNAKMGLQPLDMRGWPSVCSATSEPAVAGSPPRHPEKKVSKNVQRFAPKLRLWGVRDPRLPSRPQKHTADEANHGTHRTHGPRHEASTVNAVNSVNPDL